eukprot:CAMPEP_0118854536 /NCGR_PEP_ID=MMETSP1163-20130328/2711_1 /TAXON_ID=124430 /ORGANISM="Phaeomonas parva, Strain CCMP2877" /LENGTH=121 /DNA_ID=CAMNT_0006787275 /DNA_START=125 /DNA_END=487 /DNA_ORIENTATION=+
MSDSGAEAMSDSGSEAMSDSGSEDMTDWDNEDWGYEVQRLMTPLVTQPLTAMTDWGAGMRWQLREEPGMQRLDLSACITGDAGAEALARELRRAPSTQSVLLCGNDIDDAGAEALARELRH